MDRVAAIGFYCIDKYEGLGLSYPTGNGIDCIAHLSRRGIPCAAVSVVGTDEDGREMLRALRGLGIDVSHMQVREGQTSVFEMRVMEHYAPPRRISSSPRNSVISTPTCSAMCCLCSPVLRKREPR